MKQVGPGGQEAGPGQTGQGGAGSATSSGSSAVVATNGASGATNFEYEDSEWDVGIGSLIIDLDADIEKNNGETSVKDRLHNNNNSNTNNNNNSASGSSGVVGGDTSVMPSSGSPSSATTPLAVHSATVVEQGLKMKIKRTKPGQAKHEIVKPSVNDKRNVAVIKTTATTTTTTAKTSTTNGLTVQPVGTGSAVTVTPVVRLPAARNSTQILTQPVNGSVAVLNFPQQQQQPVTVTPVAMTAPTVKQAAAPRTNDGEAHSPPNKKWKTNAIATNDKIAEASPSPSSGGSCSSGLGTPSPAGSSLGAEAGCVVRRTDACVGTSSAMTMTEPECLGPCEPGTAVTLEGIVWHETEGGVLVVNVTWRGKTYVGTLLDCTRHDWAPPRFCDSPTSDVDSRAPKGRAKRGRGAASTPVPGGGGNTGSSAEASQSPMHTKLRNGAKGRRGGIAAPPSPAKETPGSGGKRKGKPVEEIVAPAANGGGGGPSSNKRSRSSSRGAGNSSPTPEPPSQPASPMLIECPEPNCSKKYRHINGLKYHQSHAHGSGGNNNNAEEDSNPESKDEKAEEIAADVAVAPFTGKVPMPPGQATTPSGPEASPKEPESVPQDNSTPTPTPSPSPATPGPATSVITSSDVNADPSKLVSRPAVAPVTVPVIATATTATTIPAAVVGVAAEHVFTPIAVASTATTPTTAAAPSPVRVAATPVANTAQQGVVLTTQSKQEDSESHEALKDRLKHKKKSKDKDKERTKDRAAEPTKKGPEGSTINGHVPETENLKKEDLSLNSVPRSSGREEVQSPAYSDISDAGDQPPILDNELGDPLKKEKLGDSTTMGSFVFPFYNQSPFIVNPATAGGPPPPPAGPPAPPAGPTNLSLAPGDKIKDERRENSTSADSKPPGDLKLPPASFYPFGYMPPFQGFPMEPVVVDPNLRGPTNKTPERISPPRVPKTEDKDVKIIKDSRTPLDLGISKASPHSSATIKKDHSQFSSKETEKKVALDQNSTFSRQQEELRRIYAGYHGEETQSQPLQSSIPAASPLDRPKVSVPTSKAATSTPSPKVNSVERKERDTKNEGVKPTMETHGPPPPVPPQSSMPPTHIPYSYLYPYPIPIDPSHPPYRMASMIPPFGGPGSGGPHFLPSHHPHSLGGQGPPPSLPPSLRYPFPPPGSHGGDDISRAHFELLHNHPYYAAMAGAAPPPPHSSAHKIHELAERAIKSPPNSSGPRNDPSASADPKSTPSGPNSSSSASKAPERRSPAPGPRPTMVPGPPHQMPGFLPPLPGSQYPPSSYGGKPLLRP